MTAATFGKGRILIPDKSLSFSGSNNLSMSYVNFGAYSITKLAISLWVNSAGNAANGTSLLGNASAGGGIGSAFKLTQSSNKLEVSYSNSSATGYFASTNSITVGWLHILVHLDLANLNSNDRIKVWFDGVAETAAGYSAPYTSMNTASSLPVAIGANSTTQQFSGKIYTPAIFSNALPPVDAVYAGGPRDVRGVAGLYSYIDTSNNNITDDYVLASNWTNNGSVTLSTDIPT